MHTKVQNGNQRPKTKGMERMITAEDHLAITELIAWHGHLVDDGRLDELDHVFAVDAVIDLGAFGQSEPCTLQQMIELGRALGDRNPIGHHVTNTVIVKLEAPDKVEVRSKGIGIRSDGTTGSVTYEDTVIKSGGSWKISYRKIVVRKRPLGRD